MNASSQSATLVEELKYISALIAQSRMREELYVECYEVRTGGHENFQQSHVEYKTALERLYRQILKFQATSYCYYSNNSAFRLGLDAIKWNGWEQLASEVRVREDLFKSFEQLWRDKQHLEERFAAEKAMDKHHLEELLRWLCDIDPSSMYNTSRDRYEAGTNEWLVKDSEEFRTWETTAKSLLWLHGKGTSSHSLSYKTELSPSLYVY